MQKFELANRRVPAVSS